MGKIMYDDIDFSGADIIELTQADYDALPETKYTDNITYLIKDVYSANDTRVMGIGDCYSTTERVIGCWIDGKPLYQKTWVFPSELTISQTSFTDTSIDSTDIENVVKVEAIHDDGTYFGGTLADPTKSDHTVLALQTTRNGNGCTIKKLTLQYTKISDTAGSGSWTPNGIPAVHYSTDEQVIGTWIDGKTLYQKTWELTVPNSSGTYMFSETVPNLDKVYASEYSLWGIGPRGYVPWYNSATILFSEQTSTHIEFYFASNTYAGNKIYYTSKYTKTS